MLREPPALSATGPATSTPPTPLPFLADGHQRQSKVVHPGTPLLRPVVPKFVEKGHASPSTCVSFSRASGDELEVVLPACLNFDTVTIGDARRLVAERLSLERPERGPLPEALVRFVQLGSGDAAEEDATARSSSDVEAKLQEHEDGVGEPAQDRAEEQLQQDPFRIIDDETLLLKDFRTGCSSCRNCRCASDYITQIEMNMMNLNSDLDRHDSEDHPVDRHNSDTMSSGGSSDEGATWSMAGYKKSINYDVRPPHLLLRPQMPSFPGLSTMALHDGDGDQVNDHEDEQDADADGRYGYGGRVVCMMGTTSSSLPNSSGSLLTVPSLRHFGTAPFTGAAAAQPQTQTSTSSQSLDGGHEEVLLKRRSWASAPALLRSRSNSKTKSFSSSIAVEQHRATVGLRPLRLPLPPQTQTRLYRLHQLLRKINSVPATTTFSPYSSGVDKKNMKKPCTPTCASTATKRTDHDVERRPLYLSVGDFSEEDFTHQFSPPSRKRTTTQVEVETPGGEKRTAALSSPSLCWSRRSPDASSSRHVSKTGGNRNLRHDQSLQICSARRRGAAAPPPEQEEKESLTRSKLLRFLERGHSRVRVSLMVVVEGFQQQVEAPRYAYDSAALFPSMANDFPGELPSGKSSGGLGLKNENRNSVNLWFFLRDEATRTRTRDDSRSGDSTSISNSASTWDVSEALVQCRKIVYHMDYLEYFADAEEKLDVFNEVIVRFEEALLGTPRVAARMTLGFGDPGPATPPDEEDTNPEVELRTAIDLEDDDELEQVVGAAASPPEPSRPAAEAAPALLSSSSSVKRVAAIATARATPTAPAGSGTTASSSSASSTSTTSSPTSSPAASFAMTTSPAARPQPGHVQDHLQQQVLLERFTYRPVQYKHVAALFVALFDACPHKMSYETFEKKYVEFFSKFQYYFGNNRNAGLFAPFLEDIFNSNLDPAHQHDHLLGGGVGRQAQGQQLQHHQRDEPQQQQHHLNHDGEADRRYARVVATIAAENAAQARSFLTTALSLLATSSTTPSTSTSRFRQQHQKKLFDLIFNSHAKVCLVATAAAASTNILYQAVSHEDEALVSGLLEHAHFSQDLFDQESKWCCGHIAQFAASLGNVGIARKLLDCRFMTRARFVGRTNRNHGKMNYMASASASSRVVDHEDGGAAPPPIISRGNILRCAISSGSPEMVRLVLDHPMMDRTVFGCPESGAAIVVPYYRNLFFFAAMRVQRSQASSTTPLDLRTLALLLQSKYNTPELMAQENPRCGGTLLNYAEGHMSAEAAAMVRESMRNFSKVRPRAGLA
mmetsp:Transcript_19000/g.47533  ORF Transcript_19000/g.47533 Transcript_19000/m.47533 type:complete len:1292 (-) Transcript_19000:360-4235(-)